MKAVLVEGGKVGRAVNARLLEAGHDDVARGVFAEREIRLGGDEEILHALVVDLEEGSVHGDGKRALADELEERLDGAGDHAAGIAIAALHRVGLAGAGHAVRKDSRILAFE